MPFSSGWTKLGPAVLELLLEEDPVPWQRTRGTNGQRFNSVKLQAWEGVLRERAQLFLDLWDLDGFPTKEALWVETEIWFSGPARFNRAGDADNYEKAIFDALQGVVWVNDKTSNIPVHRFTAAWHDDGSPTQVSIRVWRCLLA